MPKPFGILLKTLIDHRFDAHRAFIRVAQPQDAENSGSAYLSKVISGTKPPPMNRLQAWADALELTAEARQQFFELAREDVLDRAPDDVKEMVASLRAEVTHLRQQNLRAVEQQAVLQLRIQRLESKVPK